MNNAYSHLQLWECNGFSIIDQLYFFAKIMRDVISEFYSNVSVPT